METAKKKSKAGLIVSIVLLLAASAAAYWFFFIRMTKKQAIKAIVTAGLHSDPTVLESLGDSYIIAWGKAVRKKKDTFTDGGKTYNVRGGKQV